MPSAELREPALLQRILLDSLEDDQGWSRAQAGAEVIRQATVKQRGHRRARPFTYWIEERSENMSVRQKRVAAAAVVALAELHRATDYPARLVKKMEIQVGENGEYSIPFGGVGKGFSPEAIGALLVLFSSNPHQLANLIGTIIEKDESGKVREYLTDLLK